MQGCKKWSGYSLTGLTVSTNPAHQSSTPTPLFSVDIIFLLMRGYKV